MGTATKPPQRSIFTFLLGQRRLQAIAMRSGSLPAIQLTALRAVEAVGWIVLLTCELVGIEDARVPPRIIVVSGHEAMYSAGRLGTLTRR